ncbi:MAG: hypothetical protein WC765_08490 [Phycisphaerae bacterium]|jgi:hypothetical protein
MKLPSLKIDSEAILSAHRSTVCKHPTTELRKHIEGSILQIKAQCQTCGTAVGKTRKKSEFTSQQIDSLPNYDTELKDAYWKARNAHYDSIRDMSESERVAEWRKQYAIYLGSQERKDKRKKVIARAEYVCEGCQADDATEVHHITYEHVGDEFLFELVALCSACHERYHGNETLPPISSFFQSEKKK